MALVKCQDCGSSVSSSASLCPHCGKPRPSRPNKPALSKDHQAALAILVGVLFLAVFSTLQYYDRQAKKYQSENADFEREINAFVKWTIFSSNSP